MLSRSLTYNSGNGTITEDSLDFRGAGGNSRGPCRVLLRKHRTECLSLLTAVDTSQQIQINSNIFMI